MSCSSSGSAIRLIRGVYFLRPSFVYSNSRLSFSSDEDDDDGVSLFGFDLLLRSRSGFRDNASVDVLLIPAMCCMSRSNSWRNACHRAILWLATLHALINLSALWSVRTRIFLPISKTRHFLSAHTSARPSNSVTVYLRSAPLKVRLAYAMVYWFPCLSYCISFAPRPIDDASDSIPKLSLRSSKYSFSASFTACLICLNA